ncbi:MAG: hemerythrin family protein [Alphaproteobacteria bacterium]|nr:hemerythrin family protein [Alphaproteobacteria bacterium]
MPLMTWDSSLDVGVADMNREHQQILDLMNKIYDAREAGQTGASVIALVDRLAQVTIDHFRDEETYMEKTGYAGLASHKLIHKDLLEKFTGFADEIKASGGTVPDRFLTFLKLWLSAHIRGIDMKYGPKAGDLAA